MSEEVTGNQLSASKPKMLLERQQAMMTALKAGEFEKALQHARAALALDPSHVLVIQFVRLLEVKLSLDENDDSEDTNEDSGSAEDPEDQGSGSESESSGSDSSSSSEEEENSSSDDDNGLSVILKGNGSSTGGPPAQGAPSHSTAQESSNSYAESHAAEVESLCSGVECVTLQKTHETRKELQAKLADSVRRLKQQQVVQAIIDSDPLLGA